MEHQEKALKAYRNLDFLNCPDARTIRILAEYHEPLARFKKYDVKNMIVFFGSARIKPENDPKTNPHAAKLSAFYHSAVELSQKLTEWSLTPDRLSQTHYVCSGGGPGIMEAANRGAAIAGGKSVGLNISIPHEQYPNAYITKELMFEFHYFFIRKFWFIYLAKALVVFPGGFGTLDELMEVLTLVQTKKLGKKLPIVMFGSEYWKQIINFEAMIEWGTIAREDLDLIHFTDSIEDAFYYLTNNMAANGSKDDEF